MISPWLRPTTKFRAYIIVYSVLYNTSLSSIVGLLCWIKFFHTRQSALAATIILIPLVVLFAFFAVEVN